MISDICHWRCDMPITLSILTGAINTLSVNQDPWGVFNFEKCFGCLKMDLIL